MTGRPKWCNRSMTKHLTKYRTSYILESNPDIFIRLKITSKCKILLKQQEYWRWWIHCKAKKNGMRIRGFKNG